MCKAGAATARVTECGPTHGGAKCTGNECCSIAGFCGSGLSYCKSPDCQLGFGNCDASTTPRGADTSSVDRAPLGTVPYETDIYHCSRAGDIALTFVCPLFPNPSPKPLNASPVLLKASQSLPNRSQSLPVPPRSLQASQSLADRS